MKAAAYDSSKKELIQWINSINDNRLLNLLNTIRLSRKSEPNDWWNELSELEKESIQRGISDFEEGRTISSEDFWNRIANG